LATGQQGQKKNLSGPAAGKRSWETQSPKTGGKKEPVSKKKEKLKRDERGYCPENDRDGKKQLNRRKTSSQPRRAEVVDEGYPFKKEWGRGPEGTGARTRHLGEEDDEKKKKEKKDSCPVEYRQAFGRKKGGGVLRTRKKAHHSGG